MKKLIAALALLLALTLVFAACAKPAEPTTEAAPDTTAAPASETESEAPAEKAAVNLGLLKGPTGMGAAYLLQQNADGKALNDYTLTLAGAVDQIQAGLLNGELDIAAVPSNMAAVLYAKTEGKVKMLAVNTLGVLYIMSTDENVKTVEDLAGKKILSAGQGTTTEYVLNYLLAAHNVTDAEIEFAAEHAEVLTRAKAGEFDTVLLPEPFVTQMKGADAGFATVLDLTKEWEALGNGLLTMGCIAVRADFAEAHPDAVNAFLQDYEESINYVTANTEEAAGLIENFEIAAAAVAKAALPHCNITFMAGQEMKTNVSAYLAVLAEANPQSVGGALPGDDFYFIDQSDAK